VTTVTSGAVAVVAGIGVFVLVVGIILLLYRILRGPSLPDRAVAVDALSLLVVGLVVLLAISQRRSLFIDAALLVAIVGFATTVAFSQYLSGLMTDNEPPMDGADL